LHGHAVRLRAHGASAVKLRASPCPAGALIVALCCACSGRSATAVPPPCPPQLVPARAAAPSKVTLPPTKRPEESRWVTPDGKPYELPEPPIAENSQKCVESCVRRREQTWTRAALQRAAACQRSDAPALCQDSAWHTLPNEADLADIVSCLHACGFTEPPRRRDTTSGARR
jgi:hypothetical protein